jgi:hypothetical protein
MYYVHLDIPFLLILFSDLINNDDIDWFNNTFLFVDFNATDPQVRRFIDLKWSQISKVYLGSCVQQLYSLAVTPQLPQSLCTWAHIRGRYWSAKIDEISL